MFFRRPTELALQATLWLAARPAEDLHSVQEIAAAIELPAPYLGKVVNQLAHRGLLQTVRGPGGGVRLARPPRDISLWDVVEAMESAAEFEGCFLGLGRCNDFNPCALHESWLPVRRSLLEILQTRTLGNLVSQAAGPLGKRKPIALIGRNIGRNPNAARH
jgi:Rrf2 family protein